MNWETMILLLPTAKLTKGKKYIMSYNKVIGVRNRSLVIFRDYCPDTKFMFVDIDDVSEYAKQNVFKNVLYNASHVKMYEYFPHTIPKRATIPSLSTLAFCQLSTLELSNVKIHYEIPVCVDYIQ